MSKDLVRIDDITAGSHLHRLHSIGPVALFRAGVDYHLQDGKFSGLWNQGRPQNEAQQETDGSSKVTCTKDEHAIPTAH
jgi:hypothetical protein